MIKIYGPPRSSSGRCFWCLHEVEVPYKAVSVNMKEKEHKSSEYLKLNPNGKVPALVDGEFVIWESMAINTYLAEKYKPELLGSDAATRGLVQQWTMWSSLELQPPIIEVFIQKFFVPDEKRSQDVIEKALAKLPALFSILNSELEGKSYLAGASFTLADLHTASVASITHAIQFDLSPYLEIQRWLGEISQRPAYQAYQNLLKG